MSDGKKFKKKKSKERVRLSRLNWDTECLIDIQQDNGFFITEPATFSVDDTKQKSLLGARSPLYGTSYEDETAFIERYRCKCGKIKGKVHEDEICDFCHSVVDYKDINIGYTGWISLGDNYIINPYYYNRLCECIGKTAMPEIITPKTKVDIDGNLSIASYDETSDEKPKHPYVGIGIVEFKNKYDEIIEYFKAKKKNKEDQFDRLLEEKRNVFCKRIPVYSTFLRPQSMTSDTYYYGSIDKHINPIFSLSEKVKNAEEIEKFVILYRIQNRVNKLWTENFKLLNDKEGLIRGQILGGSLNYTARNVIIPDPTLRDDEVDLSYHTALELFRDIILRYLMNMDDISASRALQEWQEAKSKFSNKIYEVMLFIIEHDSPRILMNRNPTLNYYSMLLMKIRTIKKEFDDYTLSVPLSILPGLNADFDGDILNIIAISLPELIYAFRKFNPVERMIMSRDSGTLNEYFTLTKCELNNLYYFCTLD